MNTIRQMSKLLGITSQMIRIYEKQGLVEAERDQSNYRFFGHESFIKLLKCRRMVSFGFSMKQITRMSKGVTYQEMQGMLKSRADQLEDEIRYLVQKRNSITPVFNFMKAIHQKHGSCELLMVPATYCFPVMKGDQLLVDAAHQNLLESWNKCAFAHIEVRRIKAEMLLDGQPLDDAVMEYLINAETAAAIGVDTSLAYLRQEHLCVRAYAIWDGDLTVDISQRFAFVTDFIQQEHLRIVEDPLLFMPFWFQEEGGMNYSMIEMYVERVGAEDR